MITSDEIRRRVPALRRQGLDVFEIAEALGVAGRGGGLRKIETAIFDSGVTVSARGCRCEDPLLQRDDDCVSCVRCGREVRP